MHAAFVGLLWRYDARQYIGRAYILDAWAIFKIESNNNLIIIMDYKDDIDWDIFFNETQNEQSTPTVMDTTIPNPGGDTISDSDIAALETWVQENTTIDMDTPGSRQDQSQSPQDRRLYRLGEPLPALGQSMGFSDLASEMQRLRQM